MGNNIKKYSLYTIALFSIMVLLYKYFSYPSVIKTYGEIQKTELIDCFPRNSIVEKKGEKKSVFCEASGVVYIEKQKKVIIVHDKSVPSNIGSSVFKDTYSPKNKTLGNAVEYLQEDNIKNAKKYEDITLTPDKKYVIATTAFDRVKKGGDSWDNYNSLVYWPTSNPKNAQVVSLSKAKNSVHLRAEFAKILGLSDPYYFKIEGLTALENNRLLFGIREVGESYSQFDYTFKIISVSYAIDKGNLTLDNDFKQYNIDVNIDKKMGLSGLDYDVKNQLLYILGSYEEKMDSGNKKLGGALWVLTVNDFKKNAPPHRIMLNEKDPLVFFHKPEGITLLNSEDLLIIYDDDKELISDQVQREPHQTAYSIIHLF